MLKLILELFKKQNDNNSNLVVLGNVTVLTQGIGTLGKESRTHPGSIYHKPD